jgi:hypothetical protein
MGDRSNTHRILIGKAERKPTLGIPGCGWEDNVEIYLKEVAFEDVDWIQLA